MIINKQIILYRKITFQKLTNLQTLFINLKIKLETTKNLQTNMNNILVKFIDKNRNDL